MANKITCTCGHSWNKSDSSKKDATVCHVCGKNNMKDGGWLNKYETAENGIEGTMGGLTDQGFNYNGAWGGPSMQNGGLTFLEPTSRKLPMGYAPPNRYPSTELATSIGGVGDEPAYLIPSFKGGKRVNDPDAEFRRTGEHLGGPFKTWQEADEWERIVRHPYVEKGQNIPTPFRRWGKDFAMGGSLPGAVGFTYARTGGIPSNGPYAKKTMASAQKGASVSDNTRVKPVITNKPMTRETVRSTEPFEPKDNRSIFSDARAKERINSESGDFVQGLTTDTAIDQIPYSAYALAAKAINEGKPLTAISELVKQPLHLIGDVIVNALQENPKGIDVKTLEENTIPYARLAANALFGNPVITQIGRQRIESGKKKGSKWYQDFELPTLTEAAESYGVDGNTFTQFIEDNWNSSGGSYKKILELADKKFPKKQNGGNINKAQDGKEVEYKELPEITVVGSKDKQTRDFYNNLIDKFSEGEPASAENPFIDARVMGQYLGMMNMGKEYGFPKVKPETKSGIYRNAKGHYNPLTETIYANDVPTWVSEMAHRVQMKDNIVGKGLQWLGNDLIEYIKQPIASIKGEKLPSPYTTEGTVEHEAHSIIQPMLEERAMKDYEKYRDSELAKSREKRFLHEKRNLQNGGEMKFYQEGLDWTPKNISQDGSKTKKKKTLILAENDPELWNDKYNKGKVNPFITEAAGIKKYVNEYFPDEDVEIVPAYKDSFNEALKRSDANTRLVTLAHSGNNLFGVPVSEYLQSVSKTPYQNCYAGTCHGDDIVEGKYGPTGIDIRNLNNFNVRSNNQWQGFAPVNKGGEEGFKDSFFRRTKNPELEKINQEIYSLDNLYNNKGDKDPSISRAEYDKKLNELYKRLQATSYISNQQKATDTKTYKFVPYPARTDNDPLRFNPQNILQQKKQGGEITKDGGWLNKYADGGETPQAQLGTHMLTPDFGQVGENIMEMLSVPQKALTKLFSGKYQTPSEAMNIKNPVGAFAVDAVLDPVNLMGAGAVAKASTETGALSKAYKYNPLAFKPNLEAYYRGIGKTGLDDALSSGVVRGNPNSRFNELLYLTDDIKEAELFSKGYLAEIPKSKVTNYGSNPTTRSRQNIFISEDPIPTDNLNLYKQHWLQGYKKVKPPKKKEEGGEITKDDNGYWNPDNWGKPVEIGSNEITMEGVYEPLLGISDTGDTQMMYPGEDYTFDGESVTEYPVMQQGGRTPIYTDNPNDPRLKPYQDSLTLYNDYIRIKDQLKKQGYKRNTFNEDSKIAKLLGNKRFLTVDDVVKKSDEFKTEKLPRGFYRVGDLDPNISNSSIPSQLFKTDIKPVFTESYFDDDTYLPYVNPAPSYFNSRTGNDRRIIFGYSNVKPLQPVEYRKPQVDQFGLTKEDYIEAHKSKPVLTPGNKKGDAYYELKKNGKTYKVYTKSGGNNWVDLPEREFNKPYPIINKTPVKPKSKKVETKKPEPKKEEPIKKVEQPKPVERKQNIYEGSPVYSPGAGTGMGSALVGFANQKGDTTYIKPEDYERFAVPKYGKEFIESKKKKNGGWLEKYK